MRKTFALSWALCLMLGTQAAPLWAAGEASEPASAPQASSASTEMPAPAGTIGGMTLGEALSAYPSTLEGLPQAPREAAPAEFDPAKNPRVYEISKQLRCLVCQNENIADSNAELAIDLRREVAEQVKGGKTDQEIIDFMVERYGDYVLYNPPFKAKTFLLWCGPAIFFLVAFAMVWRLNRRRKEESRARRESLSQEAYDRGLAILKGDLVFRNGAFQPAKEEA